MVQTNSLRENYLENGYVVLKSMFNKEQISNLRSKMIKLSELIDTEDREILTDEDVQSLLVNKKLLEAVKEILNTNKLLYFSDSSIINHKNPFKSKNGFHNDARNEDENISYEDVEFLILLQVKKLD